MRVGTVDATSVPIDDFHTTGVQAPYSVTASRGPSAAFDTESSQGGVPTVSRELMAVQSPCGVGSPCLRWPGDQHWRSLEAAMTTRWQEPLGSPVCPSQSWLPLPNLQVDKHCNCIVTRSHLTNTKHWVQL